MYIIIISGEREKRERRERREREKISQIFGEDLGAAVSRLN